MNQVKQKKRERDIKKDLNGKKEYEKDFVE